MTFFFGDFLFIMLSFGLHLLDPVKSSLYCFLENSISLGVTVYSESLLYDCLFPCYVWTVLIL